MLELAIPFNSTSMPDGTYIVTIILNNGLSYNISAKIYNNYHLLYQSLLMSNLENTLSKEINTASSQLQSYILSNVSSLNNKINTVSSQLQSYILSNVSLLNNKINTASSNFNSTLTTQVNNLEKMISSVNSTVTCSQ